MSDIALFIEYLELRERARRTAMAYKYGCRIGAYVAIGELEKVREEAVQAEKEFDFFVKQNSPRAIGLYKSPMYWGNGIFI